MIVDTMIHTKEELKKLIKNREYEKIKLVLEQADKYIKGKLFEEFLAMLFEGNGFMATIKGGAFDGGADILLSYPNNPNEIVWIVQAKNYNRPLNNREITEELNKFEEKASVEYNCKYFMIISIQGYVENVKIFNKTNMSLEDYDYIKVLIDNFSENKDRDIILPDLRPHNRYTYKEVKAILQENSKVAVANATGTGKSYIIMQLLFDYLEEKKIVLAPTNEIIDQLKKTAPWVVKNCNFYTYSKIAAMDKKDKLSNINTSLIILDELHRAGADTWGAAVRKILYHNKEAKIVGFSATPIRFLDNNRNMIEELLEGNCTTPITLSDAIVRKILPNPIYVSAIYNLDKEIARRIKSLEDITITTNDKRIYLKELKEYKEIWENENKIEDIIKKHLQGKKNIKYIIFCENNIHLNKMHNKVIQWFKTAFSSCNKIKTYIITSDNKHSSKDIEEFKMKNQNEEIKLLFSISKLNEGIHIKDLTGIMMLRNTKSPNVYYQQLGRCLTTENAEKHPIIFDFVDNIDNLELINFRKSLNDSEADNNKYRETLGLCEEKINFALYEEHEDVIFKFRNIERKITYNWYEYFNYLVMFKEQYGHLNIPKEGIYERLFKWCSLQRTLYKKQILNDEFVQCLDSIEFIWDLRLENWKNNLSEYHEIIEKFYNSNILYYEIINENYYIPIYHLKELSKEQMLIVKWFYKQISEYNKGSLEGKRREILESEFRIIDKHSHQWIRSIYRIKKFYKVIYQKYNIDCYKFKISPEKNSLINDLINKYHSGNIIKNTVEKNLPKAILKEIINLNEKEAFKKVEEILKNKEIIKEYIDEDNYIYFKELIEIFSFAFKKCENK